MCKRPIPRGAKGFLRNKRDLFFSTFGLVDDFSLNLPCSVLSGTREVVPLTFGQTSAKLGHVKSPSTFPSDDFLTDFFFKFVTTT